MAFFCQWLHYTSLPSSPGPVVTRRGTFLRAAVYYTENHGKVADFVKELKGATAAAKLLHEIVNGNALTSKLCSIERYRFIPNAIARLETT